jgi:hypothetical protein
MLGSDFVIIGGDWNCTLDSRNSRLNIDTYNMAGIPSLRRSQWLNSLCGNVKLIDPYRHLYPEKMEFTYVPFDENATNRSRLDCFLISDHLISRCINCRVPSSLSTLIFDHKQVHLIFRRDNSHKKQVINDMILKDTDLDNVVKVTVLETYINHAVPSDTMSDLDIERFQIVIGRILSNLRLLTNCKLTLAARGHDANVVDRIANLRDQITGLFEMLPTLAELENSNLSCSKDAFLEILIMAIKNSSLSHQHNFFKIKNAKRVSLEKKITELRTNFNANSGEIFRTERELNNLIELDLREEIVKMKNFE